jgi:hypothetical protein
MYTQFFSKRETKPGGVTPLMRKGRKVISKAKTYGFHPWVDQVDAIDLLVAETGEKESIILRRLVDEALKARRLKLAEPETETAVSGGLGDTLETIQTILLKLVRQGDTSLRMGDISLALLQDTLAETRAGRKFAWDRAVPQMRDEGLSSSELTKRFEKETADGKRFAYGVAKAIKNDQD